MYMYFTDMSLAHLPVTVTVVCFPMDSSLTTACVVRQSVWLHLHGRRNGCRIVLIERCTHNKVFYARLHEPSIGYKTVHPSLLINANTRRNIYVLYEYHYLHTKEDS